MSTDDDFSGLAAFRTSALVALNPPPEDYANTMYDRLMTQVTEFEAGLKADEEIGARLTNFGKELSISIDRLGFHNPHLLVIHGFLPSGERCKLLQHQSQTNILLVAMKVEGRAPRRIGFATEGGERAVKREQP